MCENCRREADWVSDKDIWTDTIYEGKCECDFEYRKDG